MRADETGAASDEGAFLGRSHDSLGRACIALRSIAGRPNSISTFALKQIGKKLARGRRREKIGAAAVRAKQLATEARKGCAIVDVVPGRQQMNRQVDFLRGGDGFFKHPLGAPINLLKQTVMSLFEPNQVIPAIVRWSEH